MRPSRHPVLMLAVIVAAHLPWLLLPPINHEFAFVDAARYFQTGEPALLERYFHYQANSLGYPVLARLAMALTPGLDPLLSARLVSLAGLVLLAAGVRTLSREAGRPDTDAVLLVLLLNPLVWTFSARATADVLPAGLAVCAVALALTATRRWQAPLGAGLLLGAAAVVKYHALLVAIVLLVVAWHRTSGREALHRAVGVTAIAIAMVAAYAWVAHEAYGFWLTPPMFQSLHRSTPLDAPTNLVGYAGYVVLLTAPLSLIAPGAQAFLARRALAVGLAGLATFAVGAFLLRVQGEMGFGPLDRILPSWFNGGAFLVLAGALLAPLMPRDGEPDTARERRRQWWLAILLMLGALAMSRPAQRYLLLVIPFYLLALPADMRRQGRLVALTLIAYAAVNGFIGYAQWCSGTAARDLADRIESAGLTAHTNPGAIASHVGHRFPLPGTQRQVRYVVQAGAVAGAELSVTRGLAVLPRTYSLVRVP